MCKEATGRSIVSAEQKLEVRRLKDHVGRFLVAKADYPGLTSAFRKVKRGPTDELHDCGELQLDSG